MKIARVGIALAIAGAFLGFLNDAAQASTSCAYDSGTKSVSVDMSEATDQVTFRRLGLAIFIGSGISGSTPVSCSGSPGLRVTNVDTITVAQVDHTTDAFPDLAIETGPDAPFAPGFTDEGDGSSEIEFRVDLGITDATTSPASPLVVRRASVDSGSANYRAGTAGVNLNANEAFGDADITNLAGTAAPDVTGPGTGAGSGIGLTGTVGPNIISAQGGAGTGSEAVEPYSLTGGSEVDQLTGGRGADFLSDGEGGDDELSGEGGSDFFRPDPITGAGPPGNDALEGGSGSDLVSYLLINGESVSIDLNIIRPQDTGGGATDSFDDIEGLEGTPASDTLVGDGAANRLLGESGSDTLTGGAGADFLSGALDNDQIFARDGIADTVNCGGMADSVEADAVGVDDLTGCENVMFEGGPGPGPVIPDPFISDPVASTAFTPQTAAPGPVATNCPKGKRLKGGRCVKKEKPKKKKRA